MKDRASIAGGRWDHNIHYHRVLLAAVPAPCQRALDVGCGDGVFALRLAERAGHVDGIDRSEEAVALGEQTLGDAPNVSLRVGDFMKDEFDAGYDFISAIASLHHMPFDGALTKIKSLLRPGGTLAVLGLYDERTLTDLMTSLIAVPINRRYLRKHGDAEPSLPSGDTCTSATPVWTDPTMSLAEIRSETRRLLPGARVRRHLLWRYSVVWQRPIP